MLREVQGILVRALLENDPAEALSRLAAEARGLTAEEQAWLARIDPEGLRLTGLMVRKLRFERLTRSDRRLEALFLERPEDFMSLFGAYTAEIPPTAYFPEGEQRLFQRWQEQRRKPVISDQ
jgi:hypothetical protein